MPSAKSTSSGVTAGVVSADEGFPLVQSWEQAGLQEMMNRDGKILRIESYQVSESTKAWNVQVTVYAQGYDDQRKAEWAVFMLLKRMHPSIYKENKLAFIHEAGYRVVVAWPIWKPRSMWPSETAK